MCLAFPMKVERVDGDMADVSVDDLKSRVSVRLIKGVKRGDHVLVHAGFAIERIDEAKAREIQQLLRGLGDEAASA
jgi:hydrogenase expression/formation protein HypC